MSERDCDVLVAGCGPVGVMLALRCVQHGLRVTALDRSAEIYPLPRAIGMDDEIQRIFQGAGLIEPLREHSTPLAGAEFVDRDGVRLVGFDLPPGTIGPLGHPPMVMFDQPGVEAELRAAAVQAGVRMLFEQEAVAIDDDGDGVALTVRAVDGMAESRLTSRWLVGADGARSTVRSLRHRHLVDQGFDQRWLVVDTTVLDPALPLPRLAQQICDPRRVATFVPGHEDRRRWEFRLHDDETDETMLTDESITGLLEPWGTTAQLRIDRQAVYRFHATVADRFRDGPVFLAGDAAHQMPPFNGQGMCTGLRDAENLAWKLALVASGKAGDALLDTYDAERRPHAAGQVAHAVDAGLLIEAIATDGDAALESGYGQRPFPSLEHGLVDGDHPSVGRPLPQPGPGTAPGVEPGDGWTLIRTAADSGPIDDLWRGLGATVLDVEATTYPGLTEPGVTVVVRPDRYVAAVTSDLPTTTAHFAPYLGLPSPPTPTPTTQHQDAP
jgi:3-(3-hydroxy-phenyl)propionate hydroxylase